MKDLVSTDDHRRTLAWLDEALERARLGSGVRSINLLNLVRNEILFDIDFSEGRLSIRDRMASGSDPGPNGRA